MKKKKKEKQKPKEAGIKIDINYRVNGKIKPIKKKHLKRVKYLNFKNKFSLFFLFKKNYLKILKDKIKLKIKYKYLKN